jgi:hypothetical protein
MLTAVKPRVMPSSIYDLARPAQGNGLSASAIAQLLEDKGVARPTARSKSWHHSHVLAAVQRVETRRSARATG